MVGDDTVCGIDTVFIFVAELARIWPNASQLLDFLEERLEHIRIVVGSLVLDDGYKTLKTHTRVDVFRRKRFERTIFFAVELDENVVPDLEYIGVVLVHEMCGIATTYPVKVNLTDNQK